MVAFTPTVHPEQMDEQAAEEMEFLMTSSVQYVQFVNEMNTPLSKPLTQESERRSALRYLERKRIYIARFSNPEAPVYGEDVEAPSLMRVTSVITGAEIYLPLAGLINIEDEIACLEKEAEKLQQEVDRVEKKLSNEKFVAKAPAALLKLNVQKVRTIIQREAVLERIATLKKTNCLNGGGECMKCQPLCIIFLLTNEENRR